MLTALLPKKKAREMSKRLIEKNRLETRERLAKIVNETHCENE